MRCNYIFVVLINQNIINYEKFYLRNRSVLTSFFL